MVANIVAFALLVAFLGRASYFVAAVVAFAWHHNLAGVVLLVIFILTLWNPPEHTVTRRQRSRR
jgi:hypothetical protein